MSEYCKNCFELQNKIVECQEKYLREYEKKLDKIEQICKEAPNIDSELSMRILEIIESEDK